MIDTFIDLFETLYNSSDFFQSAFKQYLDMLGVLTFWAAR